MKRIFLLFGLLACIPASAQITFEKTFDIAGIDEWDLAHSVEQTADGGFIVGGISWVTPDTVKMFAAKTDANGNLIWKKTYKVVELDDVPCFVRETSDGGYILIGTELIGVAVQKMYVAKLDSEGTVQWEKSIAELGWFSFGMDVQPLKNGMGYIVTGGSENANWSDIYVIKLDTIGNIIWKNLYPAFGDGGIGSSVRETSDNGFIIGGVTDVTGDPLVWAHFYLLKTDSNGTKQWEKEFWGADDIFMAVEQLSDDGYALNGITAAFGAGGTDIYFLRTNNLGDSLWVKAYGDSSYDSGSSFVVTSDGEFMLTGYITRNSGDGDAWMIKTDMTGNIIWDKYFGGSGDDGATAISATSDEGFIMAGGTDSFNPVDAGDVYLIKTDSSGNVSGIADKIYEQKMIINIFPNPFTASATISPSPTLPKGKGVFILYDIFGREVKNISLPLGEGQRVGLERGNLPAGMYFYKVSDKEKILATGKIIIQ